MLFRQWTCAVVMGLGFLSAHAADAMVDPAGAPALKDGLAAQLYDHKPVYPKVLGDSGNIGKVTVRFTIDTDAQPRGIEVLYSQHPAFEQATIDAVLKSRFRPAVQNGQYVESTAARSYEFSLIQTRNGPELGFEPFSFPPKGAESLPPEFQFDTPPRIRVLAPLVYPFELAVKQVTGSAEAMITIDPAGDVQSVKLLSATHPQFGEALKAMLSTTTFVPAKKNGQRSWAALRYQKDFNLSDRDLVPSSSELRFLNQVRGQSAAGAYRLAALDARPKALFQPGAAYPQALQRAKIEGKAVVEFYVDKEGHAQLPRVISADQEELGWLAVTTVKRWRFEPPRVKGEPVDAILGVPLSFEIAPDAP